MPGTLGHLSFRFLDVVSSRALDSAERAIVESWLNKELATAFFEQPPHDQRHGYEAGLVTVDAGADDDVIVSAVLHDIGKRHSRLGVIGRVIASVLIKLGVPLTRRMQLYRDHGLTAARELAGLGAPALSIDYALHHHGSKPDSIPEDTWRLLSRADEPKAVKMARPGISSATR